MGEEVAFFGEGAFVDEGFLGDAVVGGLVVLEAEVGYLVGEGDEEVVGVVVARLVERAGFADELGELVDVLLGEGDVFGAVAGEVEVVLGRDVGGEVDLAEPAAGEDGRVDELLEGDGLEGGVGGGFGGAAGGIERGAEVPAFGDGDAGGDDDVGDVGVRRCAGLGAAEGIDEDGVPAEEREVGAGGAAFGEVGAAGGEEVHLDVELRGACGDGDVVAVHVDEVALPLDGLRLRGW